MPVNRDKPDRWKQDVAQSVDLYNQWFLDFAPPTFIQTRHRTTEAVENALILTKDLTDISAQVLIANPDIVSMLRMATAPPIAKDRLIGLASVSDSLVNSMEDQERPRIPPKMAMRDLNDQLGRIGDTIKRMADHDLFPWLQGGRRPTAEERHRAATVVADRMTGAAANSIMRNAQEKWQLDLIAKWLDARGYTHAPQKTRFTELKPGQYAFRLNASGRREDGESVAIPIDAVIMPLSVEERELPLLVEAKPEVTMEKHCTGSRVDNRYGASLVYRHRPRGDATV